MDIEVHSSVALTARQWGQRARRQREREQRTEHVDDITANGPIALQTLNPNLGHHDLGPQDIQCPECGVLHWKGEMLRSSTTCIPCFGSCCNGGDKILTRIMDPPEPLYRLLTSADAEAVQFRENIRRYNATFTFTSLGAKLDDRLTGNGFRPFQIYGEIYHQIGTLAPELGNHPVYAQYYLYDGDEAIEHQFARNPDLDRNILSILEIILRTHNPFPKIFQFAYKVLQTGTVESMPLQIIMKIVTEEGRDQRVYNQLTVNEVAALLSDDNATPATRDVIVRLRPTAANPYTLQHVPSTSSLYHLLHYVLLFPRGQCGWESGMRSVQSRSSTKRRRLTVPSETPPARTPGVGQKRQDLTVLAEITRLDFLKYHLHERADEFGLFHAGKLFHQFFIDGWASVEQDRLNWVCEHQKEIRADAYNGVMDSITSADSDIMPDRIGKRLILPSTHLRSDRHMHKLFQDSMVIVRFFEKPNLFITFTANPHWKEITEGQQNGIDRVDLVTRVRQETPNTTIRY